MAGGLMADLTPQAVRKRLTDGSLVETSPNELKQTQSELAPSPAPPPVTPRGAAGTGASADSAKMFGSSAQKQNALTQTIAASADQALQQRQVGADQQQAPGATETASRAKDLAGGLAGLGSYGARVQGLIKARLDQVELQSAAPTVNATEVKTALAGADQTKLDLAQQALNSYATSGSEADLAKIRDLFGADRLSAGGLERLYQGSPEALAQLGKGAQGNVTIGQLDLAGGGIDPGQLATDLGVDQATLSGWSPEQFQQAVQNKLNQSLSSVDALKAEYQTASPARQAQILAQLRTADTSGLAATEASTNQLADSLRKAETVKFAGQDRDINELLKSDQVSDVIRNAASNPAALQQLQQSDPDLAAWVTRNQASLQQFAQHNEQQRAALEQTQAQATDLTKDLTPQLQDALQRAGVTWQPGTMTAAQVGALKTQLQGSALYQAIQTSPDVRAALQTNPSLAEKLKDLPAAKITELAATSSAVFADKALAKVLGVDPSTGLLDPTQVADAAAAVKDWNSLPGDLRASAVFQDGILSGPAGVRWAVKNTAFLRNPDVQELIAGGEISTKTALQHVMFYPQVLGILRAVTAQRQEIDSLLAGDPNNGATQAQMQQRLFGSPIDAGAQTDVIAAAQDFAWKNTPKSHADLALLLKAYDVDQDGRITTGDFAPDAIAARLHGLEKALPNRADIINGTGPGPDPFQAGRGALASVQPALNASIAARHKQLASNLAAEKAAAAERDRQASIDLDSQRLQTIGDEFGARPTPAQAAEAARRAKSGSITVNQAWKAMQAEAARAVPNAGASPVYRYANVDLGE
jgi:hypothetical protein